MSNTTAKEQAAAVIRAQAERLIALSHRIHAHPELGFEEAAAGWLAESSADAGFDVRAGRLRSADGLLARAGQRAAARRVSAPSTTRCPASATPAATTSSPPWRSAPRSGWRAVADDVGLTCSVIGTPAEEGGGGKILLLERGVFDGVHAAMMVHPAPIDVVEPPLLAVAQFDVHYTGKEAHASAFPERGINAADALTVAQTAIGLPAPAHPRGPTASTASSPTAATRRTSCRRTRAAATSSAPRRSTSSRSCGRRCLRCFEAGALATGATLEIDGGDLSPTPRSSHDDAHRRRLPAERRGARPLLPRLRAGLERAAALDRHGQRLARDAVDPSDDRHRLAAGGEPSARVRRALRHPGRRPGRGRRRARDGVDGDRPGDRYRHTRPPAVTVVAARTEPAHDLVDQTTLPPGSVRGRIGRVCDGPEGRDATAAIRRHGLLRQCGQEHSRNALRGMSWRQVEGGRFDMTTREGLLRGGDWGPGIVPGNSAGVP